MAASVADDRQLDALFEFVRRELDRRVAAIRRHRIVTLVLLLPPGLLTSSAAVWSLLAPSAHVSVAWLAAVGLGEFLAWVPFVMYLSGPLQTSLADHLSVMRDLNETLRLLDRVAAPDPALAGLSPELLTDRVRRSLERAMGFPPALSVQVPELRLPTGPRT